MICVTDIEIINVDKDYLQQVYTEPLKFAADGCTNLTDIRTTVEMIYGETFINANGERFCIGMSKKVQDAIGIPFRAFKDMNKTMDHLRQRNKLHRREIDKYKTAGFWNRLKYLFKIRDKK